MSDHTILAAFKQCRKCGAVKPATLEFFRKRSANRDGLYSYCKVCSLAEVMDWQKKNPEKTKRNKQAWEERNPDHRRNYYLSKHEYFLEKFRQYRKTHHGWPKRKPPSTPEKAQRLSALRLVWKHNRLARKRSLKDDFTPIEWQACLDYFDHKCVVCGRDLHGLMHKASADHWIPLTRSGATTADNIVPLCYGIGGCNNSKINKDPMEWLIEKFGTRKAKAINKRVQAYFQWVVEKKK